MINTCTLTLCVRSISAFLFIEACNTFIKTYSKRIKTIDNS